MGNAVEGGKKLNKCPEKTKLMSTHSTAGPTQLIQESNSEPGTPIAQRGQENQSLANHTHKQSELYARCTHGPSVLSPEDRAGEEKHEQAEGEVRKDVNEAEPRWPLPASLPSTAPASSTSRARPQQGTLTLTPSTPPGGNRRGKTTPLTSLLTSCKNGGGKGGEHPTTWAGCNTHRTATRPHATAASVLRPAKDAAAAGWVGARAPRAGLLTPKGSPEAGGTARQLAGERRPRAPVGSQPPPGAGPRSRRPREPRQAPPSPAWGRGGRGGSHGGAEPPLPG